MQRLQDRSRRLPRPGSSHGFGPGPSTISPHKLGFESSRFHAPTIDPLLANAWGLARSATFALVDRR